MNQDSFIEKIVKRRKQPKDFIMIFLILIAAVVLMFVLSLFQELLMMLFFPILAGVVFGVYYFITGLSIEYEYIATNDDITIDKIIAKRKRKRIFSDSCKSFSVIGPVTSRAFDSSKRKEVRVLDLSGDPLSKENWFFVAKTDKQQVLIVFEPDERIIQTFKRHNPRAIQS